MFQQAIDHRTPVDFIEPQLDVRNAADRYMNVLETFARRIESALSTGNIAHVKVAFWSSSYALGLSCCEGVPMTARAKQLDVARATISKNAKSFIESHHLSPSFYMKDKEAGRSYVKARLDVVANGNGHKKWPLK